MSESSIGRCDPVAPRLRGRSIEPVRMTSPVAFSAPVRSATAGRQDDRVRLAGVGAERAPGSRRRRRVVVGLRRPVADGRHERRSARAPAGAARRRGTHRRRGPPTRDRSTTPSSSTRRRRGSAGRSSAGRERLGRLRAGRGRRRSGGRAVRGAAVGTASPGRARRRVVEAGTAAAGAAGRSPVGDAATGPSADDRRRRRRRDRAAGRRRRLGRRTRRRPARRSRRRTPRRATTGRVADRGSPGSTRRRPTATTSARSCRARSPGRRAASAVLERPAGPPALARARAAATGRDRRDGPTSVCAKRRGSVTARPRARRGDRGAAAAWSSTTGPRRGGRAGPRTSGADGGRGGRGARRARRRGGGVDGCPACLAGTLALAHLAPRQGRLRVGRTHATLRYRWCLEMYWTTPSGTRYQTGKPRPTRSRQSVDEIARAGTSSKLTSLSGSPLTLRSWPGRVTATKCARSQSSLKVLPVEDLLDGVGARDEEELGVGTLGVQVPEGVDRVGRAVTVDVDAADGEHRVRRGGDDGHQVAVLGVA